jgi:hypothetical protein
MLSVHNLIRLPPCDFDLIGIRHDHVVTAVNCLLQSRFQTLEIIKKEKHTTGVVNWLVLPHKRYCYSLRQFSKDTVFRVRMMPYACIGEGSLIKVSEPIRREYEGKIYVAYCLGHQGWIVRCDTLVSWPVQPHLHLILSDPKRGAD